jgi:hypothetical protein
MKAVSAEGGKKSETISYSGCPAEPFRNPRLARHALEIRTQAPIV